MRTARLVVTRTMRSIGGEIAATGVESIMRIESPSP
jgi:hypothetical protein